jgi:hypothetical protein
MAARRIAVVCATISVVGVLLGAGLGSVQAGSSTTGSTTVRHAAAGVSIPINRTGHYSWSEPLTVTQSRARSFVASMRVEGTASVKVVQSRQFETRDGPVYRIEFTVASFSPGASFRVLSVRAGA